MSEAIDAMRSEGAEIVDAAEFPSVVELNLAANILRLAPLAPPPHVTPHPVSASSRRTRT